MDRARWLWFIILNKLKIEPLARPAPGQRVDLCGGWIITWRWTASVSQLLWFCVPWKMLPESYCFANPLIHYADALASVRPLWVATAAANGWRSGIIYSSRSTVRYCSSSVSQSLANNIDPQQVGAEAKHRSRCSQLVNWMWWRKLSRLKWEHADLQKSGGFQDSKGQGEQSGQRQSHE